MESILAVALELALVPERLGSGAIGEGRGKGERDIDEKNSKSGESLFVLFCLEERKKEREVLFEARAFLLLQGETDGVWILKYCAIIFVVICLNSLLFFGK
jgi:hypothetical protein